MGMEIKWKILARQKDSIRVLCLKNVDNKGQQAIKTKECERQNKKQAHETKGKHKEICLGKEKNVGVNTKEIAAKNKTKPLETAWD